MDKAPELWFVNLGIKIYNLPKVFVNVFGFEIYWYAVMICLGIIMGILYATYEAKRTGQNPDDYMDFFFYAFIIAIIGARLYYVVFNWKIYAENPINVFNIRLGGLAIYGGAIGGVATAYFYAKKKKMSFLVLTDTAIPALILGQAIGRWGNLFNREVFGGYTDSVFAMRYLASQVDVIPQSVYDKMLIIDGIRYIQVQPTFLYESVCSFAIFILLNIVKKKKKFDGELLLLYGLCYGMVRFFIEGIRTDQLFLFNTGIPVSQLLSAVLVVACGGLLIYNGKKTKEAIV